MECSKSCFWRSRPDTRVFFSSDSKYLAKDTKPGFGSALQGRWGSQTILRDAWCISFPASDRHWWRLISAWTVFLLLLISIIIIIIINEKINVAFSRRTARTRNSHKKTQTAKTSCPTVQKKKKIKIVMIMTARRAVSSAAA